MASTEPEIVGIRYQLPRSYLDVARSVIGASFRAAGGKVIKRPSQDTVWGLMAMAYVFSYMAIEAFVNYHLSHEWNRPTSKFRQMYPSSSGFLGLKTRLGDLKARIKLFCSYWGIPPVKDGDSQLWADFCDVFKSARHAMVHPAPDDEHFLKAVRGADREWGFPSQVAARMIAYLLEHVRLEVPDWVKQSTQFKLGTVICLADFEPDYA